MVAAKRLSIRLWPKADMGRAVLARAKKLVANKHEARLIEVLGPSNHAALLEMLAKLAREY